MIPDLGIRAGSDGRVVRHTVGDVRPRAHRHTELELNLVVRGTAFLPAGRPSLCAHARHASPVRITSWSTSPPITSSGGRSSGPPSWLGSRRPGTHGRCARRTPWGSSRAVTTPAGPAVSAPSSRSAGCGDRRRRARQHRIGVPAEFRLASVSRRRRRRRRRRSASGEETVARMLRADPNAGDLATLSAGCAPEPLAPEPDVRNRSACRSAGSATRSDCSVSCVCTAEGGAPRRWPPASRPASAAMPSPPRFHEQTGRSPSGRAGGRAWGAGGGGWASARTARAGGGSSGAAPVAPPTRSPARRGPGLPGRDRSGAALMPGPVRLPAAATGRVRAAWSAVVGREARERSLIACGSPSPRFWSWPRVSTSPCSQRLSRQERPQGRVADPDGGRSLGPHGPRRCTCRVAASGL